MSIATKMLELTAKGWEITLSMGQFVEDDIQLPVCSFYADHPGFDLHFRAEFAMDPSIEEDMIREDFETQYEIWIMSCLNQVDADMPKLLQERKDKR